MTEHEQEVLQAIAQIGKCLSTLLGEELPRKGPVYDARRAADYLSLGVSTFREHVRSGEIPPGFRMKGKVVWSEATLERYIADRENSGNPGFV